MLKKQQKYIIIRTEWKNGLVFRVATINAYRANGKEFATVTGTSQTQVTEYLKQWLDDGIIRMIRELNNEEN